MTVGRWVRRMSWLVPVLTAVLISGALLAGCDGSDRLESGNPADEIWAEIIPEDGAATAYGIPLALDNAQQFIDWYYSISLSADERAAATTALGSLPAPCCDDFPILTC